MVTSGRIAPPHCAPGVEASHGADDVLREGVRDRRKADLGADAAERWCHLNLNKKRRPGGFLFVSNFKGPREAH